MAAFFAQETISHTYAARLESVQLANVACKCDNISCFHCLAQEKVEQAFHEMHLI